MVERSKSGSARGIPGNRFPYSQISTNCRTYSKKPSSRQAERSQSATVRWIRCYNGDTCTFEFRGKKYNVRFARVDTPVIQAQCNAELRKARQARDFVIQRLRSARVTLKDCSKGQYGRQVCEVYANRIDLSKALINVGLGRAYDGGSRQSWCD